MPEEAKAYARRGMNLCLKRHKLMPKEA